ncbi:MAG: hypothetical protein ACTSPQ_21855 [Candidatus Helarchaeota archaeon]
MVNEFLITISIDVIYWIFFVFFIWDYHDPKKLTLVWSMKKISSCESLDSEHTKIMRIFFIIVIITYPFVYMILTIGIYILVRAIPYDEYFIGYFSLILIFYLFNYSISSYIHSYKKRFDFYIKNKCYINNGKYIINMFQRLKSINYIKYIVDIIYLIENIIIYTYLPILFFTPNFLLSLMINFYLIDIFGDLYEKFKDNKENLPKELNIIGDKIIKAYKKVPFINFLYFGFYLIPFILLNIFSIGYNEILTFYLGDFWIIFLITYILIIIVIIRLLWVNRKILSESIRKLI